MTDAEKVKNLLKVLVITADKEKAYMFEDGNEYKKVTINIPVAVIEDLREYTKDSNLRVKK